MATRLVTWNLLDLTGSVYTGNVRFLFTGTFTADSQYLKTDLTVPSDADGNGSAELFVNESGDIASTYLCYLPTGESFGFTVPAGAGSITLSLLREGGIVPGDPQYDTILTWLLGSMKNSIEVDTDDKIQLVGDLLAPGASKYYGTDAGEVKGFHDLPAGGGVTVKNSIEVDAGDIQLVGDEAAPEEAHYYGTDETGTRGYHRVDTVKEVRNGSGVTIPQFRFVEVTGSLGVNQTVRIADVSTAQSVAGITKEEILDNADGLIATGARIVEGLNTSGLTPGAALWLGANGTFTETQPTNGVRIIRVGKVGLAHPSAGTVFIELPSFEVDAGEIRYDNTGSGLAAETTKEAIDELSTVDKSLIASTASKNLLLWDLFDRPDGAMGTSPTGQVWTALGTAPPTIISGELNRNSTNTTPGLVTTTLAARTSYDITVLGQCGGLGASISANVMLISPAFVDVNNYILPYITTSTASADIRTTLRIYAVRAGVFTIVAAKDIEYKVEPTKVSNHTVKVLCSKDDVLGDIYVRILFVGENLSYRFTGTDYTLFSPGFGSVGLGGIRQAIFRSIEIK